MPSGGNTMRRFETVQRSQFNLSLKLEQHESQSKKSDYQGGQLAQAGGHEQQGAVGTNYVKARPDSESSFS